MSELLDDVAANLEQLGYTTEQKAEGIFEATHPEHWGFVYTEDVGGVLIRSSIATQDGAADLQLYDLANDVHNDSVVVRIYLDDDRDLALEAWWPPVFEEDAFELFIQAWNRDISLVAQHPDIEELLV